MPGTITLAPSSAAADPLAFATLGVRPFETVEISTAHAAAACRLTPDATIPQGALEVHDVACLLESNPRFIAILKVGDVAFKSSAWRFADTATYVDAGSNSRQVEVVAPNFISCRGGRNCFVRVGGHFEKSFTNGVSPGGM